MGAGHRATGINKKEVPRPPQRSTKNTSMGKITRRKDAGVNESSQDEQTGEHQQGGTGVRQTEKSEGPSLTDIMQAINASREALESKIDTLATDMGLLRDDHRKLADRVTSAEKDITVIAPGLTLLSSQLREVESKVKVLENRAEDAENRSRRNNIKLIGVPEKGDMINFLETWLREKIAPEGLSPHYALERAHRIPARPPAAGAPPRPIIARLLHYRDRDHILSQARMRGDLTIGNSKIMIFPDFTREVQRRRASFMGVKRRLRMVGLTYSMMFPARLRVISDKGVLFFDLAAEASHWIDDQYPAEKEEEKSGRKRLSGNRGNLKQRRMSPAKDQVRLERQKAIEAVVTLSRGGSSPTQSGSEKGTVNESDSEHE